MKKLVIGIQTLFLVVATPFADTFIDTIQDLAVQTACIGQYSATEAGGGWYDDPHDYYTPQMMAGRFARMSGNKTMTTTFYGICFNYAQFAWSDINRYKTWYNEHGMYEGQFWVAGVHDNPNQIELMSIGSRNDYSRLQNGEYIKTYSSSLRNVKTHRLNNKGDRATYHAWLWIERADGVWFWIDPTWTDNLGYVVYGYVKNGEEVQCQPDKDFCINYPSYLNNLPSPPKMGSQIAPSQTSNSSNREETIKAAGTDWMTKIFEKTFFDVDYSQMNNNWLILMLSADFPFSDLTEQKIDLNKSGFALEMPILMDSGAAIVGLEYLQNLEGDNSTHAGLFEFDFTRRLFSNLAWFIGGGVGLRFDFASKNWAQDDWKASYFALKANTGFLLNISRLFTKFDISYNNVTGFSFGAGIGIGLKAY